jgi:hypothetical protein
MLFQEPGIIRLDRGAKAHATRPAIDAMFASAFWLRQARPGDFASSQSRGMLLRNFSPQIGSKMLSRETDVLAGVSQRRNQCIASPPSKFSQGRVRWSVIIGSL